LSGDYVNLSGEWTLITVNRLIKTLKLLNGVGNICKMAFIKKFTLKNVEAFVKMCLRKVLVLSE